MKTFAHVKSRAAVYDRRVDGRELNFVASAISPLQMTDRETGSTWSGLRGVATAGPQKGARLTPLFGLVALEFGWRDYFGPSR